MAVMLRGGHGEGLKGPEAALVGHSSQADLRMVAAALLHALLSRPLKAALGRTDRSN